MTKTRSAGRAAKSTPARTRAKATPKRKSTAKSQTLTKKAVAKTTVTKKSATEKAVAKKTVTKKSATKKAVAKKSATKKAVAKKSATKKAVAKKTATKKTPKPPSVSKSAAATEEASAPPRGGLPSPALELYLGSRYEPPAGCEVWNWEDYWFYGTNADARPPGFSVWRRDAFAETEQRIGHMLRSRSGFALFVFEKETTTIPWFLGFFANTSDAADELLKHED